MTYSRRTAYNRLKYDAIRQQREAIKAFKEANPERFAELLKKVEEDTPVSTPLSNTQVFTPKPVNSFNWVDKLITEIANGRKDYFIYTNVEHNGWVETHIYFEMLYNPSNVDEIVEKLKTRWNTTYLPENIKRVEKCSCPLCA